MNEKQYAVRSVGGEIKYDENSRLKIAVIGVPLRILPRNIRLRSQRRHHMRYYRACGLHGISGLSRLSFC